MMTADELNNYIMHYLEEDKTHTAIMLTGEWGSGKTYYVENVLVPFLQRERKNRIPFLKKGKENRCVVISLYGLEDISDISKSIYMELRMKALDKDSEAASAGKLIAKTVAKGIAGKLGIDINMTEDDLKKMYSSIDLSDKLLVFEDLERSNIEIAKLLGYVNNLVERDGVKVLLVANENEILGKSPESSDFDYSKLFSENPQKDEEESNKNCIPKELQKYLRIKEKTISDTICFECDYCEAVKNILAVFKNEKLKEIINQDPGIIEQLALAVKGSCHKNFRTFIFATQKTVDIFNVIEGNYNKDFLENIYFGIISFSTKIKKDEFPEWEGTEHLSVELGTNRNPLFRFCYNYIRWQRLDVNEIVKAKDALEEMKLYDSHADQNDKDLQKLYYYHVFKESEIRDVLKTIEKRLECPNDIGFYSYGKLAAYLVMVSHAIGFDYETCKKQMIKNIRGEGSRIRSELLFLPMYDDVEEKEEIKIFFEQLADSMNFKIPKNDFSYDANDIKKLYEYTAEEKNKISRDHEFIGRYDVNRLVEMLFSASAKQMEDFRDILFAVYRYASKSDFIEDDVKAMKEMLELVHEKLNSQNHDIDKIQIKQLDWLCSNLKTFISQMS